jgi:outer membrane protein assembly factor BamA
MRAKLTCLILGIIALSLDVLSAQGYSDHYYISSIECVGNRHTKVKTIIRELEIKAGEKYPSEDIDNLITRSEERLLNTGLFHIADISLEYDVNETYKLIVSVQESWYIFPTPVFSLAENSLNDWIQGEEDLSIDRVNIGGTVYHSNLTGRGDRLKIGAQFGFRHKYELSYRLPYFNREQTLGAEINLNYSNQREIAYSTIRDQRVFHRSGRQIFSRWNAGMKLLYRPKLNTTHEFGVSFYKFSVNDSVALLNPEFFTNSRTGMSFLSFHYIFEMDLRNRRPIADYGYRIRASFRKDGVGIYDDLNQGSVELSGDFYLPMNKRFTGFLFPSVYFRFIRNAPSYFYNSSFSQRPAIRGYENYDLNGMDFFHVKTGIRYLVFNEKMNLGKIMPAKSLRTMPIRFYISASVEVGGIIDPHYGGENTLDNRILVGYGPAFHLLLYEHMLLSFQFNVNHKNEGAFIVNSKYNL